ncbi:MAG: hypothetical protein AAF483_14940 [Planctomycetota bacterium]
MFASAAREVVFANPQIAKIVNRNFIPIALKAALVDRPPSGIEGQIYQRLRDSRPAPQGICSMDSQGRVIAWSLGFDQEDDIGNFLAHIQKKFDERRSAEDEFALKAERFQVFPTQPLPAHPCDSTLFEIPSSHPDSEKCPSEYAEPGGTLVGRVVGRRADEDGVLTDEIKLQENYMEARVTLAPAIQKLFINVARGSGDNEFEMEPDVARAIIGRAFLGQLDVDPFGNPKGFMQEEELQLRSQLISTNQDGSLLFRIRGTTHVRGQQWPNLQRSNQLAWSHRVSLRWTGYFTVQGDQITSVELIGKGSERLLWTNPQVVAKSYSQTKHLMAGHLIDFDSPVCYGLQMKLP